MAIGEPIPAGCAWLWPFTIAGARWFSKTIKFFDGNTEMESYALAFALCHGRSNGAFSFINDYDNAKNAILEWANTLYCTSEELAEAICKVLPSNDTVELESDEDDEDSSSVNYDDLIASLCLNVGETPQFWAESVSSDYALKQLDMVRKQNLADGKAQDPFDPYIIATRNLGRALIDIKQKAEANYGE